MSTLIILEIGGTAMRELEPVAEVVVTRLYPMDVLEVRVTTGLVGLDGCESTVDGTA